MKLTARLKAIAKYVNKETIVADVGTDHGYVAAYLIKEGIAKKVIATDVNKGPLQRARETTQSYGLEKWIETRIGNGLEPIKVREVDTVIIAGMGGLLIRDILKSQPKIVESIDRFILQPMVAQPELRRWLIENHFKIEDEELVAEDHRMYEILVVSHGEQMIEDELEYVISKKLIEKQDPLLKQFVHKHIQKQEKILENLTGQQSLKAKTKMNECKKMLNKLKGIIKWV